MNEKRETSINIAISILRQLMKGKHLQVGDKTIMMSNDGCVGYVLSFHGGIIANDLSIREIAELVEKYDIVPIPDLK